ncbi:MAG: hypothetical protein F6K17_09790 [Okeania sp. SIO3C4]|nr:hypothetical protein [Okeania sp. SIO3B3]NER02892.1 hypothetical protein [Okeania sp. SIO3C4]
MNTYTLEEGRQLCCYAEGRGQKAEGNIGSRPEVFFITDYPNMILDILWPKNACLRSIPQEELV